MSEFTELKFGAMYKGEMKDGKPAGIGIYISSLGIRYEGSFRKGKKHYGYKYFNDRRADCL